MRIKRFLTIYSLAVKYWLQGDDWEKATEYARALVQWTEKEIS